MERQAEARIAGGEWEGGVGVGKEWCASGRKGKRGWGRWLRQRRATKLFLMVEKGSKKMEVMHVYCTVAVTCDTSFSGAIVLRDLLKILIQHLCTTPDHPKKTHSSKNMSFGLFWGAEQQRGQHTPQLMKQRHTLLLLDACCMHQ